jgi:hypothetical protein
LGPRARGLQRILPQPIQIQQFLSLHVSVGQAVPPDSPHGGSRVLFTSSPNYAPPP